MTLVHAIVLGIVEGLTEFLPVSSTGHLILASHLLKLPSTEFLSSFEIAIQVGAILAVVVLYSKSAFMNLNVLKRVCVAFLPTAVVGFMLYKLVKQVLFGNVRVVLASLFLGGLFLIIFERFYRADKAGTVELENISYRHCFLIGLFQSVAVIPGVSRSAATIIGGLMLGLKRKVIVEFSFLLAVPTILAATAFDLLKTDRAIFEGQAGLLAAGFLASFIVAILSIKFFLYFIQNRSFSLFGFYRIALAVLFWFIL